MSVFVQLQVAPAALSAFCFAKISSPPLQLAQVELKSHMIEVRDM
jgi:hypothetical protein